MQLKLLTGFIILFGYFISNAQVDPNTLLAVSSISSSDRIATTTATNGTIVFDSDLNTFFVFDGTSWKQLITTPPKVTTLTGNYTLTEADNYSILTFDSAADVTLTVPAGLTIGFNVSLYQIGAGQVTIVGTGATVKNRLSRFKTAGLDAGVGIVSTATDTFHVTGDLKK